MSTSYEQSTLLKKIKTRKRQQLPLRIAFLDIDSTMTGNTQATNHTRKKLEELGYGIVYVTARTEEMIMSSKAFKLSQARGFDRPEPHLGRYENKRIYIPPEQIEPEGLLDPDVIAGSHGTAILLKQTNGSYIIDTDYIKLFQDNSETWRKNTLDLIEEFNSGEKKAFLSKLEDTQNYIEGITDVFTQKYRIGLLFQSPQQKRAFRSFIKNKSIRINPKLLNLTITDDSQPEKELFLLVLTPKNFSKKHAVDHIIGDICKAAQVNKVDLHILMAGDNIPDIDMGLRAAKDTHATFILAGGSFLAHALTCENKHSEYIESEQLQLIKTELKALKQKGYYSLFPNRDIIVSDEVFTGKIAVDSILALLPDIN